ncbi:conserved hypothetical protein [Ricinus communis]|uniref:HEAT repeat domain-containing protein n=1 Tax=Ricinus communis TaxID=3988 RepID=B9TFW9_RICCO|nr:conserved hypothetical protein [Ricinus communis]
MLAALLGATAWRYLPEHSDSTALVPAPPPQPAHIDDPAAWALAVAQDDDRVEVDAPSPQENPSERMAQLAAQVRSEDADVRAAALDALARMPKAQAVPILRTLLSATDSEGRQGALDALRTLAVDQGDGDGAIGDVLRLTIYDGDDAATADSAQLLLDTIQQSVVQTIERKADRRSAPKS